MRDQLRYLRFDLGAFLNDEHVAKMNAAARGVYISALCWCWIEGSLPDDCSELAPLLRLRPAEVKKSWPEVRKRFHKRDDGRLVHLRMESDRAQAIARYDKAVKGGRASADARKQDDANSEDTSKYPEGSPEDTSRIPSTIQHQHNQSNLNQQQHTASPGVDDGCAPRENDGGLISELTLAGFTAGEARRFAEKYDADRIRRQIANLATQKRVDNPGAWLRRAIDEDYSVATGRGRRAAVQYTNRNDDAFDLTERPEYYSREEWEAMHPGLPHTPDVGNGAGT